MAKSDRPHATRKPASQPEPRPVHTDPAIVDDIATQAAERMLGPNPFIGLRETDLLSSGVEILRQAVSNPKLLAEQEAQLGRDLIAVMTGASDVKPEAGDKRFQDVAWTNNPFLHAMMQSHLVWKSALTGLIDRSPLRGEAKERAMFVGTMIADAFSPTNTLLGNPAAMKTFIDTGGMSLVRGIQNMLRDWTDNNGMPLQVDKSAFEVGRNLAVTRGDVVFRNEVLELIQYEPTTERVHATPLLMIPPQINKYYVFDMSPGKSLNEYLVSQGLRVFEVSWRNPTAAQRGWGMDEYVAALIEAIDVARDITGADKVNVAGACSGAMTMSALMGYLAQIDRPIVNSATLMVAVLDSKAESQLGAFVSQETIAAAKSGSSSRGVLEGAEMGRVFAWMRPNDLVWSYWVNNYLHGNPPPVFDILYWNNDPTRLPARFHSQLLDIFSQNLLVSPGAFEVLGKPIDLSKIDCDKYFVAGATDHITPWKGVYNTTQTFGGASRFILSSSGHIQSLINPPTNQKAKFFSNDDLPADADDWLRTATSNAGSWWPDWSAWLAERSGPLQTAQAAAGNARYAPIMRAPGSYVLAA